jgi:hypothetical protein
VDLSQGLNPVVAYNVVTRPSARDLATVNCGRAHGGLLRCATKDSVVPKLSTGKLFGIIFGVIVVAVMIFMMFAVISGLIHRDQ